MDATLEGHLHRRCGGRYAQAVETVTIRLSGMSAKVDRELFRCDKCGDVQHTVEQREAAEREAVLTMRHDHALLTGKEIRQFRDALGLSAEQLGGLLHGMPRGIVEGWEKGRYLQSPTVDAMIRSLADPEERETRAAKAGLVLPPLPGPIEGAPPAPAMPEWAATAMAAAAARRAALEDAAPQVAADAPADAPHASAATPASGDTDAADDTDTADDTGVTDALADAPADVTG